MKKIVRAPINFSEGLFKILVLPMFYGGRGPFVGIYRGITGKEYVSERIYLSYPHKGRSNIILNPDTGASETPYTFPNDVPASIGVDLSHNLEMVTSGIPYILTTALRDLFYDWPRHIYYALKESNEKE